MKVNTDSIRVDLGRFHDGLELMFDRESVLDALFELDRLREAVSRYLDNDCQANWDRLARMAEDWQDDA